MTYDLILLAGQRGHGKDSAGTTLLDALGPPWARAKFAAPVYDAVAAMLGTTVAELEAWKRRDEPFPGTTASVRRWLQSVGDGARGVDPDLWINRALPVVAPPARRVFTDGRYPNELDRARALGGFVVLVHRPGHVNDDHHPTEAHLRPVLRYVERHGVAGPVTPEVLAVADVVAEEWDELETLRRIDHVLRNDGSPEDLRARVLDELLPRVRPGV